MKHKPKTNRPIDRRWLAVLGVLVLMVGCAGAPAPPPSIAPQAEAPRVAQSEGLGWRFIRFRMDRPQAQTRWETDLLIANGIVAPILETESQTIRLWRFHRRSADDDTGHQFSFIFYADAGDADRINQTVMAAPLLGRLLDDGAVREVRIDAVDRNDRPGIGDTSDPNWSPVMQASWPYFIMGVSRMWLAMIDRLSREIGIAENPTLEQRFAHYQQVNAEVTRIWQQEGYHALLHHLNAIYGYEALIYWEKHWKAF